MKIFSLNLTLLASLFFNQQSTAQNIVDKEFCNNWNSLQETNTQTCILSNDGKFIVYQYGSRAKGNTIVLKSINGDFERCFLHATDPSITEDSKRFVCLLPGDTLLIYSLRREDSVFIPDVQWYRVPKGGDGQWLLYKKKGTENLLLLKNLFNGVEKSCMGSDRTVFNERGTALLVETANGLILWDLLSGREQVISKKERITEFCFDNEGKQIAFLSSDRDQNVVSYFSNGMRAPAILAKNDFQGIEKDFQIAPNGISFTSDGKKIFFKVRKKQKNIEPEFNVITRDLNVWTYKDIILQQKQLKEVSESKFKFYSAIVNISSSRIIQLDTDTLQCIFNPNAKKFALLKNPIMSDSENYWNGENSSLCLLSLDNGSLVNLLDSQYPFYSNQMISPDERFVVWFNISEKRYYSYEIGTGTKRAITEKIRTPMLKDNADLIRERNYAYGIGGWLSRDSAIFIYDRTDIWMVDPLKNRFPVNITNQYGLKNNITLRFASRDIVLSTNEFKKGVLLTAFNNDDKSNGFYKVCLNNKNPERCILNNYTYFFQPQYPLVFPDIATTPSGFKPLKARDADVFVVRRMSSAEAPELFVTADFRHYKKISNIHPEPGLVKSILIKWKLSDGRLIDGILHTPCNLDSSKKYPVIFNYYERRSEGLNVFRTPELSGHNINIPWYISRGYLVFEPDFYYTTGNVYKNIIDAVNTAASQLATLSFVDTSRMGAQGQSFGGYETNVIVTGTNIFKAACSMAGPTNIVSEYGSLRPNGQNNQTSADRGQRNIAKFPWDSPSTFIDNSPIFQISKANTPFLLVHNREDEAILFSQAIELYLGMRRIGKKIWMLEYDGEEHVINRKENKLDYTIRMQQFFDYYLKGGLPPIWMTRGIQARDKGIKSGLESDFTGAIP